MWRRWVGAIAVGDGRQINGAEDREEEEEEEGGEGEVESRIGGIERNPEDGWERDRLPRAKGRKKGWKRRHAAGRTERATEKL